MSSFILFIISEFLITTPLTLNHFLLVRDHFGSHIQDELSAAANFVFGNVFHPNIYISVPYRCSEMLRR